MIGVSIWKMILRVRQQRQLAGRGDHDIDAVFALSAQMLVHGPCRVDIDGIPARSFSSAQSLTGPTRGPFHVAQHLIFCNVRGSAIDRWRRLRNAVG